MRSLATVLRHDEGRDRGRASLRVALAVLAILFQGVELGGGPSWTARLWISPILCLGGLATSLGLAAARQRARQGWRATAGDRLRLAVPVYAFAVLAAAFALGPAMTSVGVGAYAADPETYGYLLNLVGVPQYRLPGVFEFNNVPEIVNALVWVAPVAAALLVVACLPARGRLLALAPALLAIAVALAALVGQGVDLEFSGATDLPALLLQGDGLSILLGGLLGIAAGRSAERVPLHAGLAGIAGLALAGAAVVGDAGWLGSAAFRVAISLPVAYLVLFLTFRSLPLPRTARRVEPWLPGLLLFAFPVQQVAAQLAPDRQGFLPVTVLGGLIALLLAAGFWRLIGRRLASGRTRAAMASDGAADESVLGDFRRWRRWRRGDIVQASLIPLVLGTVFIGVMVLVYIALQPDGM